MQMDVDPAWTEKTTEVSLATIRCQTLVLSAAGSTAAAQDMAERVAAALPEARLERLAGTGHMAPLTDADLMADALDRFHCRQRRQLMKRRVWTKCGLASRRWLSLPGWRSGQYWSEFTTFGTPSPGLVIDRPEEMVGPQDHPRARGSSHRLRPDRICHRTKRNTVWPAS